MKIKDKVKKFAGKAYLATAGAALAMTPTAAGAEAPSAYVNRISDNLFGEILKVAPKVALVVLGWALLMYLMSGDDHKKGKYKGTAFIAIAAYLILLVLDPLLKWMGGLV